MAKRAYAKTVASKQDGNGSSRLVVVESDRLKNTTDFGTLAEQAARSSIFHKNYYVEELREQYKHFDRMKRVDKAFPYAKLTAHGETTLALFDEPKTEADLEVCYQKAPILKRLGYRYAIIERDSSLFDLLEQLGAI